MSALMSTNQSKDFCIWQQLLAFLGEDLPDRCATKCTRCQPKDGDVRVQRVDECHMQKTPSRNIQVYAFALGPSTSGLDIELVKKALIDFEGLVAAGKFLMM